MKNYVKLFVLSLGVILLANSCGEERFDIMNGGTYAANLYVTSDVKFFVGVDNEVKIDFEKYENEGVSVSSIDYNVVLTSTLGTSSAASFSSSGTATVVTVGIDELLAALPVNGSTLQQSDLVPGDRFNFDFGMTLSDGSVLNIPSGSIVTVQCRPAPGDYRVVMHDSYGDGWQTNDGNGGDGLRVTLDDGTILEVGMCSPYLASSFECVAGPSLAEDIITIPEGTKSADWYFPGDAWGEISFEIYSPEGDEIFASGAPGALGAGNLPIINCE
jgi:hypothetical protein